MKAFFVRKERKEHGLQRWIEGPELEPGEACLVVEDVVTTGGSTIAAIERIREEGLEVAGVVFRNASATSAADEAALNRMLRTLRGQPPQRSGRSG